MRDDYDDEFDLLKPDPRGSAPSCPITGGTVNPDDYFERYEPDTEILFVAGEGDKERRIDLTLGACRLHAFLVENTSWTMSLTPRARRRAHGHMGIDLINDRLSPTFPALDEAIESHGLNNDAEPGSIRFNVGVDGLEHKIELAIPGDVLLQLIEDHGVSVERSSESR